MRQNPTQTGIEKRNLVSVESPSPKLPECSWHSPCPQAEGRDSSGYWDTTGDRGPGRLLLLGSKSGPCKPRELEECWGAKQLHRQNRPPQGERWGRKIHFLSLISINRKWEKVKARILAAVSLFSSWDPSFPKKPKLNPTYRTEKNRNLQHWEQTMQHQIRSWKRRRTEGTARREQAMRAPSSRDSIKTPQHELW